MEGYCAYYANRRRLNASGILKDNNEGTRLGKSSRKKMVFFLIIFGAIAVLLVMALLLIMFTPSYPSPGRYTLSLEINGRIRNYLVYIPSAYDGQTPLPLVIALHGYTSNPRAIELTSGLSLKAEEENFIVIYPQGIGPDSSWNAGFCCGQAALNNIGDVDFIRRLVEKTQEDLKIDSKRIYATGHSNGGMMSHRLAAELSDIFAAIAVVSGSIGKWQDGYLILPNPSEAVSVIVFHGMQDWVVPYNGGSFSSEYMFSSVNESVSFWVQANHCSDIPQIEVSNDGNIVKTTYTGGVNGTEVVLYTIMDGTHSWAFNGISTTDLIWDFFSNHPKP
ncbi:MAG: PHB depolymerase family esterase [Thermoproteota archaeon]